jgi:hypothetical protein
VVLRVAGVAGTARSSPVLFTSADELCAHTQLAPGRVDELRELMIFT